MPKLYEYFGLHQPAHQMSTATTPYINVTEVEQVGGYRLRIQFNDGHVSVVDFEPFLRKSYHPDIQKYLDLDLFRRWTIDHGNLYWNDYDLIFPTADLYAGHIS